MTAIDIIMQAMKDVDEEATFQKKQFGKGKDAESKQKVAEADGMLRATRSLSAVLLNKINEIPVE